MSRYLADTTTLIDFVKDREPVRSRLLALIRGGAELAVCAVAVTAGLTTAFNVAARRLAPRSRAGSRAV